MKYQKVVGIGHSCVPAYQIRKWIHQSEAYFFDWLVVPPPALIQLIRGGLMKLFDSSKFEVLEPPKPTSNFVPMTQRDLKVNFYHDFRKDRGMSDFNTVRNKYQFLAERWNVLMNSSHKILLIRHHINKQECIEVQQVIKAVYPKLDFEILAVNECDPNSLKWEVPGIYSRYVKPCPVWHSDDNEWLKILNEVTLDHLRG
jgi:hypothetical protein